VRWPGRLPAGAVSTQVTTTMDLTASFLRIAGAAPPQDLPLDGLDILQRVEGGLPDLERSLFWRARRGDRTLDGSIHPKSPAKVDRIYQEIPCASRILDSDVTLGKDSIVISSSWFGPLFSVKWTITGEGLVRLDYEYRYDGVVELMGIRFDYPESRVNGIRWLGQGPYRVWQNRLHGTRLDVWENAYNDPVPARSSERHRPP